jgi:hypothetical protein
MERYEMRGVKVYQLNICEAIGDHHRVLALATRCSHCQQTLAKRSPSDGRIAGDLLG